MTERLALCELKLKETEAALSSATDQIEDAREWCREQITIWRLEDRKWRWIKKQPTWQAFIKLGGS